MKKTGVYRVWQVLYPIGIYYVVSSVVYFILGILLGTSQDTYMMRQMICGAVTIPFILSFYNSDKQFEEVVYGKNAKAPIAQTIENLLVSVGTGMMLGIAVNNLIAMTPLMDMSVNFHEANTSFFAGAIVFELLGSCLVIPIAEELLYRGVVFKRLQLLLGKWAAIVLSAVIFGVMHANLVQFLYAGILGVLLAFLLDKTGKLYAPVLGHISANLAAVIRQETGWLDFAYEPGALGISISVVLLGVTLAVLFFWNKRCIMSDR